MASPTDLGARERLVNITLPAACLAQEITDQRRLASEWQGVLQKTSELVGELQARAEAQAPAVRGQCAADAMALLERIPSPAVQSVVLDWLLVERAQVHFLLAQVDTPIPAVLLVRAYGIALKPTA